ncbi:EF-P beta-lysylation protein EpmB [Bacterioplanes sanyensis]|uniref:L-lysine 2,3-aminomutase n=1 Tax=Bacterioplanes sanyensis TaxID=1249553 RepID=A0A222FQV4_9GAMM|nr:EF-P beta-lysylation protein EpmB [Bacterioplanes sanyensis]ASP40876.1 EF-P beta-lysylation protein EpmB [Bacterioplanes sanyensis]
MRIITRTEAAVEPNHWQDELARAFRRSDELLEFLRLDPQQLACDHQPDFPMLVPRPYAEQMRKADPNDPLLLQVLPLLQERDPVEGYTLDPLDETSSNAQPGIIHKYHGRVLLMLASGCAVNCRYCFRRHFPYADNRIARRQWQQTLDYLRQRPIISEAILSGGDPLMLDDEHLSDILDELEGIAHLRRLRIHSRLPVVIPQRLTSTLAQRLEQSRLQTTLVLHINHANELSEAHRSGLKQWRDAGMTLLNQSVLLKRVNDEPNTLIELSERLFEFGVLPYYLHAFDAVAGAAHFDTQEHLAQQLHQQMQQRLPGYLVPKLVREIAGRKSKTLINLDSGQSGNYNGM